MIHLVYPLVLCTSRIRAITDNPNLVWTRELSNPSTLGDEQRDEMYCLLVDHAKR